MKSLSNKNSSCYDVATVLFIIGYAVFLITLLLTSNIEIVRLSESGVRTFDRLFKYLRYASYVLFVLAVSYKIIERKMIVLLGMVAFFLAVELTYSSNNTMLLYVFLFLGTLVVSSRIILTTSLVCKGTLLFCTVLASQIGIIDDYVFADGERTRHGLGFSWTTTSHILFLHLLLEYICLRKEKITFIEYVIMELLNIWFYKMTDTSMTFYIITAYIVFFVIVKIEKEKFKLVSNLSKVLMFVPTVCAFVSIALQYYYVGTDEKWQALDKFTHGRIKLGYEGINNYGITLLGQHMKWVGFSVRETKDVYNYIDCSYLQLAIEYGLLFLILVLVLYTVLIWRGLKAKDYYLVVAVSFLMVFAMTEPRLINLMYTSFPLLVLAQLQEKDNCCNTA